MKRLRKEFEFDYGHSPSGSLKLFRDAKAFSAALLIANRLQQEGLRFRALSADDIAAREPALVPIGHELVGGIHYPDDESGDAWRFCIGMTQIANDRGVKFVFGGNVTSIHVNSHAVRSIQVGDQSLSAAEFVVAAAAYSAPLLRSVGIELPTQPAKGYSVTFHSFEPDRVPTAALVDDAMHSAIVALDGKVRVAGTAEFSGFDLTMDPARVRSLVRVATQILPRAGLNAHDAQGWCGLRSMAPDGVPIIGMTSLPNLWISCGHGHLGWTTAAASARLLADLITKFDPEIDPAPYAFSGFRADASSLAGR